MLHTGVTNSFFLLREKSRQLLLFQNNKFFSDSHKTGFFNYKIPDVPIPFCRKH